MLLNFKDRYTGRQLLSGNSTYENMDTVVCESEIKLGHVTGSSLSEEEAAMRDKIDKVDAILASMGGSKPIGKECVTNVQELLKRNVFLMQGNEIVQFSLSFLVFLYRVSKT